MFKWHYSCDTDSKEPLISNEIFLSMAEHNFKYSIIYLFFNKLVAVLVRERVLSHS